MLPDNLQCYNVKTAARLLGIHERTLWTIIKERGMSPVRVGHSVRLTRQELSDFIRRNSSSEGSAA
jgi:excisionase family DNA binding protein